ncbi:MAG: hypothetical protein K0V04_21530 [Deltaproteobacteria bacterium]|nr:hypothetical protein [Deltaproteobacteria bacterium]
MDRIHTGSPLLLVAVALWLGACSTKREDGHGTPASTSPPPVAEKPAPVAEPQTDDESDHHVVFADRTSQTYLLLVPGDPGPAPSREALAELVRTALSGSEDEPEVKLLLELVASEPARPANDAGLDPSERESIRHRDLLGLHLQMLPLEVPGEEPLISSQVLTDPISTRTLSPSQRDSLADRRHVLLLRAHYRNRFGVRGLRLLQTLIRIVARERGALVHDPDTGETMTVEAFTERRLQSTVGNVADQLVVIPFPDRRHGEGSVRLTTRGMRRFGSVDLELDGLPRDPAVLEAATHLINGLAYAMVRMGEYDREGYAVEADDVLELDRAAVLKAYAGRDGRVPKCEGCPGLAQFHLVERPTEPQDPVDHVVARIVAPRPVSDAAGYDHPGWVRGALSDLLGVR